MSRSLVAPFRDVAWIETFSGVSMPFTINPTIARLAALCDESGLTRAQIGERMGTSQGNISRLLSGERDPALSSVERLLAAIGYRMAFEMDGPA